MLHLAELKMFRIRKTLEADKCMAWAARLSYAGSLPRISRVRMTLLVPLFSFVHLLLNLTLQRMRHRLLSERFSCYTT